MLSTGHHTWTICTSACGPEHAARSVCKGLETTELYFIVVGLLAQMYMWSLNLNSVTTKKKRRSIWKCDFSYESDGNVPAGQTVAPTHGEDSFTATLLVWDLKTVTFPVTCAFIICLCEGTMGAFYTGASTDVDIMYSGNFVMLSKNKQTKKKSYQWSEQTLSVPNGTVYLWSTSIILRRQLVYKVSKLCCNFFAIYHQLTYRNPPLSLSAAQNKKQILLIICVPSFSHHQIASFFYLLVMLPNSNLSVRPH